MGICTPQTLARISKTPYRTGDSFGRVLSLHLPCFAMEGVQGFDLSWLRANLVQWEGEDWIIRATFPRARRRALMVRSRVSMKPAPKVLP